MLLELSPYTTVETRKIGSTAFIGCYFDYSCPSWYDGISRYQRKKIRSSEELYTENKCYILNLQNVRATKIGKNSESKEIL
jgi:hypothetical protein